jgi:hypothetical protein
MRCRQPGDPQPLKPGMIFPSQSSILETEIQAATRVANLAFDAGLARVNLRATRWPSPAARLPAAGCAACLVILVADPASRPVPPAARCGVIG